MEEEEGRKEEDYEPPMPPVSGAAYLLGDLFAEGECGITVSTGMGPGPLTHEAIRAWMRNTNVRRRPWECRFLVRLSHEYLAELQVSAKRDAEAPWIAPDEVKPQVIETKAALRALANL